MLEEFKEVHWNEIQGNVYSRSLTHAMLHSVGDRFLSVTPVVKAPRKDKQAVYVKYDRAYVRNFIAKKVIEKLQPITKETLHELIDESWESWQELKHKSMGEYYDAGKKLYFNQGVDEV